jgi:AraC-like DNA-binding protein
MLLPKNNPAGPGWLEVCPLAHLRAQPEAALALPYYSVVVASSAASGQQLHFSGPGQLVQVLAQVPAHAWGEVARFTDTFLYAAGTTSEPLLSLFHDLPTGEPLLLPEETAAEVTFLLASMQQPASAEIHLQEALVRTYLHALLLRCLSLRRQQAPPALPPARPGLFLRFRQLLEQYYTEWKSVTAYANQLCVTPNHLNVCVKRETGRPASDHIRQRIMLEAQRLATTYDAPLKEIAYRLGFEDVAHFSKLFKRCHGVSFSSFKAQVRQPYKQLTLA